MNKTKTKRIHDNLYLKENRYKKPKEVFKLVLKLIKKNSGFKKNLTIGDYGCANGESTYFFKKNFKAAEIIGYDILQPLIHKARKEVKNVKFVCGSVLNRKISKFNSNDVSICIGVLSIFDSFEIFFNNLIHWTKPKGRIYVHSFFNEYPFDINIKYSSSKNWVNKKPKYWESGYNIFSKKTISKFLKNKKEVKNFKFHKFTMKKKINQNPKDYLRAWTIGPDKKKMIVNGLNIIQTFYFIEIILNK